MHRYRFSIRLLLLLTALVALFAHFGPAAWISYRHRQDRLGLIGMRSPGGKGVGEPIFDGQVILLRKGDTFAAFIPQHQSETGESLAYRWYYRDDGGGSFDELDAAAVQSGTGTANRNTGPVFVTFGKFKFEWSQAKPGWGWIYFDRSPRETIRQTDTRYCLTNRRSVNGLDAKDAHWMYKGSALDSGVSGATILSSSHDGDAN